MFENLKNGWAIASQTRKAIFKDKGLFIYPVLSAIVAIAEALVIFLGLFLTTGFSNSILDLVGLFIFYLLSAFTSTYLLMALMIAFRSFEKGKRISMGEALGQTSSYTGVIFEWAIFMATVIMILRMLESRTRGVSTMLISSVGGAAISIATLFAVPVILDERTGPIKTIEGSVKFFTKNFGSTFGGIICSDLYGLAFIGVGILIGIATLFIGSSSSSPVAGLVLFGIAAAFVLFGAVLSSLITNIFKLVLYDYRKTGDLPDGFDKSLMQKAVRQQGRGVPTGAL